MRNILLALVMAGFFSNVACAQSSVTLYGLLDAGVTYTNNQNGHTNVQQTSGSDDFNRWGIRGVEDLGDGLHAIFTLENGFLINSGAIGENGRIFGRQAFVGLSSDQYGQVTLGRQYDSVINYLSTLSLSNTQYGGAEFAHPFDNDNFNDSFRISNSVKFQSVNYSGFKFGGLYGFSNDAGAFANNRAYSFGASYNYGGLTLATAYLQLNENVSSDVLTNTAGVLNGDNIFTAGRTRTWGAGLQYVFGAATADFVFTQTALNQAFGIAALNTGTSGGFALNGGSAHFNNYEINGIYNLTPKWTVAGSYTYTDGSLNSANPKWNQFNLQTAYSFTKRTEVYLQGAWQHISPDGLGLSAAINGLSAASSNGNQVAVTAGIFHRF
jgi:GBP family porin